MAKMAKMSKMSSESEEWSNLKGKSQKPVASLAAALDGNCTNNSAFRPFTPCPMLQFIIVVRTELNSLLYWLSQGGDVPQNGYSPSIKEIKVLDKKKVRRAKLYYLRDKMNALRK
ncbi:hypothetical protein CK203_072629 [Vitis vinifera]|uniref:Uncharacterized protein n=1 Tax=Vitis vinifera TaxID=29760 RepID=A0A438EZE6_VITVI|nr:hypothetical protein CK203_072629 [Vitis vinifera]